MGRAQLETEKQGQMVTFTGNVTRMPIVRDKVIFSSIDVEGKPLQVTLFRQRAPQHYAKAIANWELEQEVTVSGSLEKNPFTGEDQLIINAMLTKEQPQEAVTLTQTITITKDDETFTDQWGRNWFRVPDRF